MPNECRECGAKLKNDETVCAYCGTVIYDDEEQLLMELTAVARKFKEALARANLIKIEKLLADEYKGSLIDAGVETVSDKKTLLNAQADKNFVSYNIHDVELIERKEEKAVIRCIQTVTRLCYFEKGKFEPYIERGTISFIRRNGRWLIVSQNTVTIDENGNEYE